MYKKYIKRTLDFIISLFAIIVLSPIIFMLSIIGCWKMKGNPYFTQERSGWHGIPFKMLKFRTMTNERDNKGELLPDEERLNSYGKVLRATSLDELPELFNILFGHMAIVGPRPLITGYMRYYTEQEKHRHDVRPGLTGLAQVNGRSFISWEEIFKYDIDDVQQVSLLGDLKIIILTISKVLKKRDVVDLTKAYVGKDGKKHIIVDGKDMVLHQPLSIERECMNVIRNRE